MRWVFYEMGHKWETSDFLLHSDKYFVFVLNMCFILLCIFSKADDRQFYI